MRWINLRNMGIEYAKKKRKENMTSQKDLVKGKFKETSKKNPYGIHMESIWNPESTLFEDE